MKKGSVFQLMVLESHILGDGARVCVSPCKATMNGSCEHHTNHLIIFQGSAPLTTIITSNFYSPGIPLTYDLGAGGGGRT